MPSSTTAALKLNQPILNILNCVYSFRGCAPWDRFYIVSIFLRSSKKEKKSKEKEKSLWGIPSVQHQYTAR
jgi:hypothetical protein